MAHQQRGVAPETAHLLAEGSALEACAVWRVPSTNPTTQLASTIGSVFASEPATIGARAIRRVFAAETATMRTRAVRRVLPTKFVDRLIVHVTSRAYIFRKGVSSPGDVRITLRAESLSCPRAIEPLQQILPRWLQPQSAGACARCSRHIDGNQKHDRDDYGKDTCYLRADMFHDVHLRLGLSLGWRIAGTNLVKGRFGGRYVN